MAESLRRKAIKINKNIRGEKLIGSAGEAFTLFSLNMMGVEADLVKQDGTDIVATKSIDSNLLVAQRIEVKTATFISDKNLYSFSTSKGGDKRPYTKEDCDILALCAVRQKAVLFFNVEKFQDKVTKKIHINDFLREEYMKQSWQSSLYESQKHTFNLLKRERKNVGELKVDAEVVKNI